MAKQEPARVPGVGGPTAVIESVVITWCSRKRHARRSVSVDLNAVGGIIWRHPLGESLKPVASSPPSKDVPFTRLEILGPCEGIVDSAAQAPDGPDSGSEQTMVKRMMASTSGSDASGFCWWDGNQWICPDDPVDQ